MSPYCGGLPQLRPTECRMIATDYAPAVAALIVQRPSSAVIENSGGPTMMTKATAKARPSRATKTPVKRQSRGTANMRQATNGARNDAHRVESRLARSCSRYAQRIVVTSPSDSRRSRSMNSRTTSPKPSTKSLPEISSSRRNGSARARRRP